MVVLEAMKMENELRAPRAGPRRRGALRRGRRRRSRPGFSSWLQLNLDLSCPRCSRPRCSPRCWRKPNRRPRPDRPTPRRTAPAPATPRRRRPHRRAAGGRPRPRRTPAPPHPRRRPSSPHRASRDVAAQQRVGPRPLRLPRRRRRRRHRARVRHVAGRRIRAPAGAPSRAASSWASRSISSTIASPRTSSRPRSASSDPETIVDARRSRRRASPSWRRPAGATPTCVCSSGVGAGVTVGYFVSPEPLDRQHDDRATARPRRLRLRLRHRRRRPPPSCASTTPTPSITETLHHRPRRRQLPAVRRPLRRGHRLPRSASEHGPPDRRRRLAGRPRRRAGARSASRSSPARARGPGAPGLGAPHHFALRQAIGVVVGAVLGAVVVRVGIARVLRAAPALFVIALLATAAVFVPGVGVRAAGASRWLHLGPLSGSPAPFLIGATGLLMAAAWGGAARRRARPAGGSRPRAGARARAARGAGAGGAAGFLGGRRRALRDVRGARGRGRRRDAGWCRRRRVLLLALALGASRFGYVGSRIHGFLSPRERPARPRLRGARPRPREGERRRPAPSGWDTASARRHLSSPASDYVFAIVNEELGGPGAWAVVAAWAAIAAGAALAARCAAATSAAAASRPPAPPRCSRRRRCTSPSAAAGSRSWA